MSKSIKSSGSNVKSSGSSVKDLVDEKIKGKKLVVFVKSSCPYCSMVKSIFQNFMKNNILKSEDYEVVDINGYRDTYKIQSYLGKLSGQTTVPRVFINGKSIGGADDTKQLLRNGRLKEMLQE